MFKERVRGLESKNNYSSNVTSTNYIFEQKSVSQTTTNGPKHENDQ